MNTKLLLSSLLFCYTINVLGNNTPSPIIQDFIALLNHYTEVAIFEDNQQVKTLRTNLFISDNIEYHDFSNEKRIIPLVQFLSSLPEFSIGLQYTGKEIKQYKNSNDEERIVVVLDEIQLGTEFLTTDTLIFAIQNQKIASILLYVDNDGDAIDNDSDLCPNEKGEITLFGCPDDDKDGVPNAKDECQNTPSDVKVTVYGCWDEDQDGIPNFRDNCVSVPGIDTICGCPADTHPLRELRKLNSLDRLHSFAPITALCSIDDKLISGDKNGLLVVSCVKKKKFRPHKLKRNIEAEPNLILPLSNNELLVSSKKGIKKLELGNNAFSKVEELGNLEKRSYKNLKRLDSQIFLQEFGGWLQKTLGSSSAKLLSNTWQLATNSRQRIATYNKDYTLQVYNRVINEAYLEHSFDIKIDNPIYLEPYQDTSWLFINNQGTLEMTNHICLGAIPKIDTGKQILSIKQTQNHELIAFLYEDKTWEIWQKHDEVATWRKIDTKNLVKERTTAIAFDKEGNYFFEGTDDGILQAYLIE